MLFTNMEGVHELKKVTRVVVVDHAQSVTQVKHTPQIFGRVYEKWGIRASLSLQDDGRTLKIFVGDPK
jgi:hypothetical protein